jgi:hypothetical protein
MPSKTLRGLFVAYVAATALHVGWVVAHEPFAFDAWNVAQDTDGKPFTVARFCHYWWFEYTHSNPRLGQALTYLAYKLDHFAAIASACAFVAIALAVVTLGLRRFPSWKRGRDLALWAFVSGALWFALPQLGKTLFCRAYAANYVYGLAIQLWFIVPLRLAKRAPGRLACVAYLVFGLAAGLCNEHTGPTLCAFMLGLAWWQRHERKPTARLVGFGAIGAIVGFGALFFAPGQGQRYDGLAQKVSLAGRLFQRGVTGNLDIIRDLLLGLAPVLALIAIIATLSLGERDPEHAERDDRKAAVRMIAIAIVAALAMAATIFVSPKLGSRFYLGSGCLLLAGLVALADAVSSDRAVGWLVVLALASSIYAAAHTMPLYGRVSRESIDRMAGLSLARPGSVYIAESFDQVDDSWWFLGDDFRDARKRDMVAKYYGLAGVVFHAYDPTAPLGVAGARFVPIATLDPPGCFADQGGLVLASTKGFDLAGLDDSIKAAIALAREKLAPTKLLALTLEVQLDGPRVALPAKHIVVAKWQPDRFEAYVGAIDRKGRSTTRDIALPKELQGSDAEIFVYEVGGDVRKLGTARGEPLQYVPWKSGVYWVLACRGDECFVIAASRQGG